MGKSSTIYINGKWIDEEKQSYFESIDPFDHSVIGTCSVVTSAQLDYAVEVANDAFQTWKKTSIPDRAQYLIEIGKIIRENKEELSRMMTRETGKVINESRGEVDVVIATCEYMAGEGRRLFGEVVPSTSYQRNIQVVREPIGVVACITPWNFPVSLAAYKIFAALISGNTVIWKPASEVALSAKILIEIIDKVNLPNGVVNLITGSGKLVGSGLAKHEKVSVVAFTGSTEVGLEISEFCSKSLKKVSLELGGKNAIIVLKDADINQAAAGIVQSSFATSGQRCTASSRVIVEKEVKEELLEKVLLLTKELKMGSGLDEETNVGPLVNQKQLSIVKTYVEKALLEGNKLEYGGTMPEHLKGNFFTPTIFTNVNRHNTIAQEEIFGPVVAFIDVGSYEEAMEVNNDTIYGLSTSIYTRSLYFANMAAKDAESGLVYINSGTSNAEMGVAFGGKKMSGNGHREVSHHSLDIMTDWKSIYTTF